MIINHIVAMTKDNVIGLDGKMPWHLPEDLQYFKKTTMGWPVIMGRKTFESIGRPLPGRLNIVLSTNPDYQAKGVQVASGFEEAKKLAERFFQTQSMLETGRNPEKQIFIIGGQKLYSSTLDQADRLYITEVEGSFKGDTWYPKIDPDSFTLQSTRPGESVKFSVYDRK